MGEQSKIEWTDHTFNPWIGCQKVSPGCDHCYAETWDARGLQQRETRWGPHAARTRTGAANWRKPLAWDRAAKAHGKRAKVFCASLADVGDNHHTILREWRDDLMNLVERTPHLDWLFLTKRPQNIARLYPDWMIRGEWPSNLWIGTTCENQAEADRRIPHLLAIPAPVRFISAEPLLGPVDLLRVHEQIYDGTLNALSGTLSWRTGPLTREYERGLDWVICGGESGPNARPMHPDWARDLRDQCTAAGVSFFFKQWGEWVQASHDVCPDSDMSRNKAIWLGWNGEQAKPYHDGLQHPIGVIRVGKRAAGRLLDGREWNEFPQ